MFPDDDAKLRGGGGAVRVTRTKATGGEQPRSAVAVVAAGGQRGTLYDSFELNAMVARLNRLLNGDGGAAGSGRGDEARARRPRKAAGSWLAAPKVLFRRIKGAFLGGRRGDG